MNFIDFHTHLPSREGEIVIQDGVDTWGIHPWKASSTPIMTCDSSPIAIGECGLDKCCDTPFEIQMQAFRHCVLESERLKLPLFLHCVRTIPDCLCVYSQLKVQQYWIWHGYRGKVTQLQQLLSRRLFFSFGFKYNTEALLSCPLDRLLMETDEDPRPVSMLYQEVATLRNIPLESLIEQMHHNYSVLFGQK